MGDGSLLGAVPMVLGGVAAPSGMLRNTGDLRSDALRVVESCSVVQCVAACCSVLWYVVVCCSVLQ